MHEARRRVELATRSWIGQAGREMEKIGKWTTPEEAAREAGCYWMSRSIEERVSAVEVLRGATLGVYGDVPARLERIHQLVVLERR